MQAEFTEFEENSLRIIAQKDEWELSTLKGLVKHKMFEGMSFQRAVMLTLAQAKRPVDIDPKRKEILDKAVKLRDKMLADYNNYQAQKKAGIIVQ